MSRTPLREALLRLQAEGLIEVTPRHGLRVLPLYPADLREIYELLGCLEATAAEMLAKRRLPADSIEFRDLEEINERMRLALEQGDRSNGRRWMNASIVAWSNNAATSASGASCSTSGINRIGARMLAAPLRPIPTESYKEHRAVLEAAKRGDDRVAYELHRAHRHRGMVEILGLLERHHVRASLGNDRARLPVSR